GRPQGATRPMRPTPVPTMSEQHRHRHIVGTGAVRMGRVAPCGRPFPIFCTFRTFYTYKIRDDSCFH
ncbi:MAG: hypothetical protein ACYDER_26815, partial [Ktedonobacteraceae bacterium]